MNVYVTASLNRIVYMLDNFSCLLLKGDSTETKWWYRFTQCMYNYSKREREFHSFFFLDWKTKDDVFLIFCSYMIGSVHNYKQFWTSLRIKLWSFNYIVKYMSKCDTFLIIFHYTCILVNCYAITWVYEYNFSAILLRWTKYWVTYVKCLKG